MKKRTKMVSLLACAMLLVVGCAKNEAPKKVSETKQESQEVVLYVTRHGKTIFNTLDRVQGWSDTPLTAEGIEVAESLGKGLKSEKVTFDKVYASDLSRAKETAQIVLDKMGEKDLTIQENKGLREACYGMFEGDFNKNMVQAIVENSEVESDKELMAMGMDMWKLSANTLHEIDTLKIAEDEKTIIDRMKKSLESIAKQAEKDGDGNILVVGHGMSISLLINELSDMDFEGHLPNASVSKFTYKDGKLAVESIGDTSYIEAGKEK